MQDFAWHRWLGLATCVAFAACQRGPAPQIMASSADLQLTEVRCEQMLDGKYVGAPVACNTALHGYMHDHSSERIAGVIPLSPTSPPKYFGLDMFGATESLLVLHTPK